jgi:hypothetical protein
LELKWTTPTPSQAQSTHREFGRARHMVNLLCSGVRLRGFICGGPSRDHGPSITRSCIHRVHPRYVSLGRHAPAAPCASRATAMRFTPMPARGIKGRREGATRVPLSIPPLDELALPCHDLEMGRKKPNNGSPAQPSAEAILYTRQQKQQEGGVGGRHRRRIRNRIGVFPFLLIPSVATISHLGVPRRRPQEPLPVSFIQLPHVPFITAGGYGAGVTLVSELYLPRLWAALSFPLLPMLHRVRWRHEPYSSTEDLLLLRPSRTRIQCGRARIECGGTHSLECTRGGDHERLAATTPSSLCGVGPERSRGGLEPPMERPELLAAATSSLPRRDTSSHAVCVDPGRKAVR